MVSVAVLSNVLSIAVEEVKLPGLDDLIRVKLLLRLWLKLFVLALPTKVLTVSVTPSFKGSHSTT